MYGQKRLATRTPEGCSSPQANGLKFTINYRADDWEITHRGYSSAVSLTFDHRSERRGKMKQCWRLSEEGRVASVNSRLLLCSLSFTSLRWPAWVLGGQLLACTERSNEERLCLWYPLQNGCFYVKRWRQVCLGPEQMLEKRCNKTQGLETAQMQFNVHTNNKKDTSRKRKWVPAHPLC